MDCVAVAVSDVSQLLPPLITAGFVAGLFTKDVFMPLAALAPFWYIVTYLAYFFEAPVDALTTFLVYPYVVFVVALAFGAFVSQIGDYPRVFDYAQVLRTFSDAASRPFDRRRTVWEGVVFVLSIFLLYLGGVFLSGAMSDGCLQIDTPTALLTGWLTVLLGIIGIVALIIVTLFNSRADNVERLRMWKYALAGLFVIGGHVLLHDLLYAYADIGIFYGLVGLLPVVIFWIALYWWILRVEFFDETTKIAAFKALGDSDDSIQRNLLIDTFDGFKVEGSVIAFAVTGGLYNFLAVFITWLISALTVSALWTLVGLVVFTVVCMLILIILAWTTNYYASMTPKPEYLRV